MHHSCSSLCVPDAVTLVICVPFGHSWPHKCQTVQGQRRELHPGAGENRWAGRHSRPLSLQADGEQGKDSLCDSVRAIRAGFDAGAWGPFRQ